MIDVGAVMSGLRGADPQDLADLLQRVAAPLGTDVTLYLVDFQQVVLQAMPSVLSPRVVPEENVATSLGGRAFTTAAPVTTERPDGVRIHCTSLSDLAGLLVQGASRYTDLMHVRRRGRGMSPAASMQWDLLPPLTLRSPQTVVSGLLEPAHEVAGDAFDYALNGHRLDIGLFDGMGHGIASSLLTNLAVGAYRHARRDGADVPQMHRAVDAAVAEQYDGEAFVTRVFARLQLDTGRLTWTDAGHPAPLLLRGRRVVGRWNASPRFRSAWPGNARRCRSRRWSPATRCCSTPTVSPTPEPRQVASWASSGWSTCSSARRPPRRRPRRSCAG